MNSWENRVKLTVIAKPIAIINLPRTSGLIFKLCIIQSLHCLLKNGNNDHRLMKMAELLSNYLRKFKVTFWNGIGLIAKETEKIELLLSSFLKIIRLPDMVFKDKILAIVDFGNIKYLNLDFKLCHTKKK